MGDRRVAPARRARRCCVATPAARRPAEVCAGAKRRRAQARRSRWPSCISAEPFAPARARSRALAPARSRSTIQPRSTRSCRTRGSRETAAPATGCDETPGYWRGRASACSTGCRPAAAELKPRAHRSPGARRTSLRRPAGGARPGLFRSRSSGRRRAPGRTAPRWPRSGSPCRASASVSPSRGSSYTRRSTYTRRPRRRTARTSSQTTWRGRSRQHPDLDVAVRDLVTMVLETDVAGGVTPVMRVTGELARLDFRRPVGTPELVVDHLHAVQPVLDVFPLHHESHLVPLARGLHDAGRRGIHVVGRTRRRETRLAVHVPRVIQHLHLRRVPVDGVVVLATPVENPAVPGGRDVPFECQLEIPKLVPRDDVAGGVDPGQRAVHDLPAGRHRVLLVRSEERRVGEEGRSRGAADHLKKKKIYM